MFNTITSENIFVKAWDNGYIRRCDWELLIDELDRDDTSKEIANRLLHAVRRGRLKVVD